ncbi:MAG TPA: hypothetical protein VHG88_01915 [Burkholderiales bacterium]|nr:hypothetical protein [Burkholderiales bacterium]
MRTLFWLGLGAAAMYLLDPEQGRRRRALMRDQAIKARRLIHERASGTARDLGNRAYGAAAEARRAAGYPLQHESEQEPSQTPPGAHHLGR